MKKWALAIALFFAWTGGRVYADQLALTTIRAIQAQSTSQNRDGLPVAFEATVTYFRAQEGSLFVQDGSAAIYVQATTNAKLTSGDRVLVRGVTRESFRPIVQSSDITVIGHGAPPTAEPATFDQMIQAKVDCRRILVRGKVLAADTNSGPGGGTSILKLLTDGGLVVATVDSEDESVLRDLLDAEVEVAGAESGIFDGKMQVTGVEVHVPSFADVHIVKPAMSSPWKLPVTPMDQILGGYKDENLTPRIRVQGTITYDQPGRAVVLQAGTKSLWIETLTRSDLKTGEIVDATGFPEVHDGFLRLVNGEIEPHHQLAPIEPHKATWRELAESRNIFDLVSIEGVVVSEVRGVLEDKFVLQSDGNIFLASIRRTAPSGAESVSFKEIAPGSKVRVTGICMMTDSNPFNTQVPFDILLRSPDDVTVIAKPPLLTEHNLARLVDILVFGMLIMFAWGWSMRRQAYAQTAALARHAATEAASERHNAELQRRRSSILEDINGTREIGEILDEITKLATYQLKGPPCWCEMADGVRFGEYPANAKHLRIVSVPMQSRSEQTMGTLFAGFYVQPAEDSPESRILVLCAQLATLAIETRRFYNDLVHRSEFDLLTESHNRSSLEKRLDLLTEDGLETGRTFGIIYIDLDDFKLVNDRYGHRVGDLYLQDVVLRVKRQLRASDTLARLGGDEFAVLMSAVSSRTEVEEAAHRVERCLIGTFTVEGCILHGSASVGFAFYPEDGTTSDGILNAADAAMYVEKHLKRQAHEADASSRTQRRAREHSEI